MKMPVARFPMLSDRNLLYNLILHRESCGKFETLGVDDETLATFLNTPNRTRDDLVDAITQALVFFEDPYYKEMAKLPELEVIDQIGDHWCNFYPKVYRIPFIPVSAKGSWMVSLHGAVINDAGGYGMVGLGHNPSNILEIIGKPYVQANIITPSLSHLKLMDVLRKEIGKKRGKCPYEQFLLMNSGSEGNSVISRIMDSHLGTRKTENESKMVTKFIALKDSFHGRTFEPASWTDSAKDTYKKFHCAKLVNEIETRAIIIPVNDIDALEAAFASEKNPSCFPSSSTKKSYIQFVVLEAVMGEGNPGERVDPKFYKRARELTLENDGFLIVDSVQAGIRAHGVLSIVDYPGFETLEGPDFEVFSKAINAGQFPISMVGLSERASKLHNCGIYGNTMTSTPRACEIIMGVLREIEEEKIPGNIEIVGEYALLRFKELQEKYPTVIEKVTGCGLLYAVHLNMSKVHVINDGVERFMRHHGIGVIHGGVNALRFTPQLKITKEEIDLQVKTLEKYILTII
jgi:acetylornithine/succinyldiaminopimelate/putrescine aminotransferase